MGDNNEQFKWLKLFLQLFVFALLSCRACPDNSTEGIITADNSTEGIFTADNSTEDFLTDLKTVLGEDYSQPQEPVYVLQCGLNEASQFCQIDCIDCEHRGMCEAKNCDFLHCDCRMNFVHLTPAGPCEHITKCPPRKCPRNEEYRHCGSFCESCDRAKCRELDCSARCYCKAGYRRHVETGKCIPENECPERLTCNANDVLAKSGPAIEYCLQSEAEALRVNETIEEEKCYCEKGFKRNIHGWCIDETLCPFVKCFGMTEHQECPRKCNTSCWNYGDPTCEEDGECYPGCFCPENYVLNEVLECIPVEMCPPGSNPSAPPLPPTPASPIPQPTLEDASNATTTAKVESGSAAAGNSSAETEATGSSEAPTESATTSESPSGTTENAKEVESEESTPGDTTTEAPKKPPKKATKNGKGTKSYKNAKSSKSSAVASAEEEENE